MVFKTFITILVCFRPSLVPFLENFFLQNLAGCQRHSKSLCADPFSHVQLFATPWTIAHHVSLSKRFPRQEYQSGLPFPIPGDLPNPGTEPPSPMSPTLAGRFFTAQSESEVVQSCLTLCDPMLPTRLLHPWNFLGKSNGVGCHFLLQGSSQPRDRTQVSCIAGRCFTIWATRESYSLPLVPLEIPTWPPQNSCSPGTSECDLISQIHLTCLH